MRDGDADATRPRRQRLRRSLDLDDLLSLSRAIGASRCAALRGVDLVDAARRDPRPRRRIRLGQDDAGARHHAARAAARAYRKRRDPLRRPRSARLDDEALRAMRGRDIAMIIPNPRGELDPLQTGRPADRQHRSLPSRARAGRGSRARALDMLRRCSIPDPSGASTPIRTNCRGGMAQRVVIAIALACSPKLHHLRRRHQRPRRHRPGAGSGPDRRPGHASAARRCCSSPATSASPRISATASPSSMPARSWRSRARERFFDDPLHPYSVMLLAAFAHNARLRRTGTEPSRGSTARRARPAGCAFAERCVRRRERCRAEPAGAARRSSRSTSCAATSRWSA